MTYVLDESRTSNNFTPAASVQATFGYPRNIGWITIHHWGNKGQNFGTVRDYLCTNTTPTSAHFVAEDGQVACIVSPLDAAWHAGNAKGNAQSIGIECRPEATDGDYATIGELIARLRSQYGDVPLVPHNYWTSTSCPGDYDLARLDSIARSTVSAQASTITPIEQDWLTMATKDEVKQALAELLDDKRPDAEGVPTSLRDLAYVVRALVHDVPNQTMRFQVARPEGGTNTLGWSLGAEKARTDGIAPSVLNQTFTANGNSVNLAGLLAALDARPAVQATVTLDAAQVAALADQLRATLPAATVAALAQKLA